MGPGGRVKNNRMTSRRVRNTSLPSIPTRRPARRGFTMIEVIVASVILGAALLAMAGFTVRYQQVDANARTLNRAQQAANERLETVRSARPYLSLDTMTTTESTVPGYPGYVRYTTVTQVGGEAADTVDYKIVTVKVKTPGVVRWATKTSIIGAF
jgi:prepilin-type N-terminal cleavage/methylation domain-containing protein